MYVHIASNFAHKERNYKVDMALVWRSQPFTKRCAGEMVWNHHAIHRVVTLEFHYCKPLSISNDYFSLPPQAKSISATCESSWGKIEAYQYQLASRPAGAVIIFTRSRNAATGDNSMYCMIPDPFPRQCLVNGRLRQTNMARAPMDQPLELIRTS